MGPGLPDHTAKRDDRPRIWFDLDNLPDVNVFGPIIRRLARFHHVVTTRRFSGIEHLIETWGLPYVSVGTHQGSNPLAKGLGTATRTLRLALTLPRFDASVASLGAPAVLAARMRGRPALGFLDGDLVTTNLRVSAPFVDRLFVPSVFRDDVLDRFRLQGRAVRYDGFKEDLAAGDYVPDPSFPDRLPFKDYVVVRPEALRAEYVPGAISTLVPDLLRRFQAAGINVLYLPRYPEDRHLASRHPNVFAPEVPVNGLDASYHARAVLTGSGTLAREAAVLGVPAASFFPGPRLLSVDREMVRRGWMMHSRDPEALVAYALTARRRAFDQGRCLEVLGRVVRETEKALSEVGVA